jgi:hypothetical protein
LAEVHVDGCEESEKRMAIFLDPKCQPFNEPGGQITDRRVLGADGIVKKLAGEFKDLGMDPVLQFLDNISLFGPNVNGGSHDNRCVARTFPPLEQSRLPPTVSSFSRSSCRRTSGLSPKRASGR